MSTLGVFQLTLGGTACTFHRLLRMLFRGCLMLSSLVSQVRRRTCSAFSTTHHYTLYRSSRASWTCTAPHLPGAYRPNNIFTIPSVVCSTFHSNVTPFNYLLPHFFRLTCILMMHGCKGDSLLSLNPFTMIPSLKHLGVLEVSNLCPATFRWMDGTLNSRRDDCSDVFDDILK